MICHLVLLHDPGGKLSRRDDHRVTDGRQRILADLSILLQPPVRRFARAYSAILLPQDAELQHEELLQEHSDAARNINEHAIWRISMCRCNSLTSA